MKSFKKIVFIFLLLTTFLCLPAHAATFYDDFNSGANAAWGNEVGNWYVESGVYNAASPNNSPPTYSSVTTLSHLTDFVVNVDINSLSDGGIFLRSTSNQNGVLLVTGGNGRTYNGLYWHTAVNGSWSGALNRVDIPGLQGSDIQLTIEVIGDTYKASIGGYSTTLTTNLFSSGSVALYDFSGQSFDNFSISAVPLPGAFWLIGSGLLGLVGLRKRFNK